MHPCVEVAVGRSSLGQQTTENSVNIGKTRFIPSSTSRDTVGATRHILFQVTPREPPPWYLLLLHPLGLRPLVLRPATRWRSHHSHQLLMSVCASEKMTGCAPVGWKFQGSCALARSLHQRRRINTHRRCFDCSGRANGLRLAPWHFCNGIAINGACARAW